MRMYPPPTPKTVELIHDLEGLVDLSVEHF